MHSCKIWSKNCDRKSRGSPEYDVWKIPRRATRRSRQCCNRIRSPGNVNKIRLTNHTSVSITLYYTASDKVHTFSSSPHKTPLQHQTSHFTGLRLVERSPTLRHGLLVVCCRRTFPDSICPRPRYTSTHFRSIKDHDQYPTGALAR